jgi:hypothetical protein
LEIVFVTPPRHLRLRLSRLSLYQLVCSVVLVHLLLVLKLLLFLLLS